MAGSHSSTRANPSKSCLRAAALLVLGRLLWKTHRLEEALEKWSIARTMPRRKTTDEAIVKDVVSGCSQVSRRMADKRPDEIADGEQQEMGSEEKKEETKIGEQQP